MRLKCNFELRHYEKLVILRVCTIFMMSKAIKRELSGHTDAAMMPAQAGKVDEIDSLMTPSIHGKVYIFAMINIY